MELKRNAVEAYPLYWPEGWKRTERRLRRRSAFGKSTDRVKLFLRDEVTRLGGAKLIVSTNVPLRADGDFFAKFRTPDDPGVAVYFDFKGKPICFACDRHPTITENLQAIAMTIEALCGIQRWGASDMLERAFKGFAALPSPSWRTVLNLPVGASLEDVENRFRTLAYQHHPDRGGDAAHFHEIVMAREAARKELRR